MFPSVIVDTISRAITIAPLQIYERREGSASLSGWTEPGYNEGDDWQPARLYNAFEVNRALTPGNLLARPILYMRRSLRRFAGVKAIRQSDFEEIAWNGLLGQGCSLTLAPNTETIVEIDAGEETCGYPSLRLAGGTGAEVELLYAEAYSTEVRVAPDGQVYCTKTDRCDSDHGQLAGNSDHYRVGGFGTATAPEVYTPFWFRTFRFVRLSITTGNAPLTLVGFAYEETGYPLEPKTRVSVSDVSFDAIWDISLRSLRRCMHETYMDCPYYEQLQYAMDGRNEILYTYAISMDDRLARLCMDDFRRSQRYDGLLNCSAPNFEANIIPGFSIYYILMLYDHMMYFGDRDFIRGHLACVEGILHYFHTHQNADGLVGHTGGVLMESRYWSFIDWTPPLAFLTRCCAGRSPWRASCTFWV